MADDRYAEFYRSDDWWRLRQRTLRERGYICVVCSKDLRGKGRARVDHITPVRIDWSRRLDPNNLRCLCPSCDNKRHSEKNAAVPKVSIGYDGYPEGSGWS